MVPVDIYFAYQISLAMSPAYRVGTVLAILSVTVSVYLCVIAMLDGNKCCMEFRTTLHGAVELFHKDSEKLLQHGLYVPCQC